MRAMVIALVLVAACHPPTPYWKSYSETPSGKGQFLLRIHVTDDYEDEAVARFFYRRAGDLCPNGYDGPSVDQLDVDSEDDMKTAIGMIRCKQ